MTSTPDEEADVDDNANEALPPGMQMDMDPNGAPPGAVAGGRGQAAPSNGVSTGIGAPANQTLAQFLNRTHVSLLVRRCFMSRENTEDALDVILSAAERYSWCADKISAQVKRNLDDRLGAAWHVIVGETFAFEITFESDAFIYVFYGSLGIVAWKCGNILLNEIKHKKVKRLGGDDE